MKSKRSVAVDPSPAPRRSRPAVAPADGIPMRDLSAAAITTNRAQLHAYGGVLEMLVSMRRIQIATLVGVGLLATFVAVMTYARSRELAEIHARDQIQDNRLDALEHRGTP